MTTGYDVHGLAPCPVCGQPNGMHLPMCELLGGVQAIPAEEVAQVEEQEKKLGEAI